MVDALNVYLAEKRRKQGRMVPSVKGSIVECRCFDGVDQWKLIMVDCAGEQFRLNVKIAVDRGEQEGLCR